MDSFFKEGLKWMIPIYILGILVLLGFIGVVLWMIKKMFLS